MIRLYIIIITYKCLLVDNNVQFRIILDDNYNLYTQSMQIYN
jgi:hypothetical protein